MNRLWQPKQITGALSILISIGISQIERPQATGRPPIRIDVEGRNLTEQDLRQPINKDAAFMHGVPSLKARPGLRLTGQGVVVGVWDGGPVLSTHQAFGGRIQVMKDAYHPNHHATHVAGTIAAGAIQELDEGTDAIGMAESAQIASYDFCSVAAVPNELKLAVSQNANMRVTNHSWGVSSSWAEYETLWRDFDAAIIENPSIIAIVAAGNDRPFTYDTAGSPAYSLPPVYGNIRSPGIAKNVITVGAMVDLQRGDDVSAVGREKIASTYFSSLGPTPDGRIKPDVIANGWDLISPSTFHDESHAGYEGECWPKSVPVTIDPCKRIDNNNRFECYQRLSGTSMATPVTSGVAALLQEFALVRRGSWLLADEMKAILVHTATSQDDRPTYMTGWGAYRADMAADVVESWQEGFRSRPSGQIFTRLTISSKPLEVLVKRIPGAPVRVTLVWLDDASTSLTSGLNIDLDVSLTASNGQNYLPWTLDPANPGASAVRGINSRDTVERIDIAAKEKMDGNWRLRIAARKANGKPISFALISLGLKTVEQ